MAEVERIADLLRKRNRIDREISKIIGRPSMRGVHRFQHIQDKT